MKKIDFDKYPICDADIWVYLCLGDLSGRVIDKYEKIVFADVVEKEIMAWDNKNDKFQVIASSYQNYKKQGKIKTIYHKIHMTASEQKVLEQVLLEELSFTSGLKNDPREEDKGEFVSALYADHFNIPFMKTNDNEFQEGGRGRVLFPDLNIKSWYDVVENICESQDEKIKVRSLVEKKQEQMNREREKQKMLLRLQNKFNSTRL